MSRNDVLTYILMFFHQKFCRSATLLTSPLLACFTAITDHLSTGEVRQGRYPQCGAVPVNILIFLSWSA